MRVEYFLGRDRMRTDLDQGTSVVWFSGDSPRMLMVQHAERRYIEWGAEQLKMMQRMPAAGGGNGQPDLDISALRFEETGQTGTVGDWDAFEVRMTGMGDQTTTFWMTTDIDVGLFEINQRVAEAGDALRTPTACGRRCGRAGVRCCCDCFRHYRSGWVKCWVRHLAAICSLPAALRSGSAYG